MIFIWIAELVQKLQAPGLVAGAAGLGALWLLALRAVSAARRRAGTASAEPSLVLPLLLVFTAFCALDGLLLWSLPHLRISYAPDSRLSLTVILMVRLLLLG